MTKNEEPQVLALTPTPRCVEIAEKGITNSQQTIRYLSALVADASAGRVTTGLVHGACNAVGKILRVVELESRYGTAKGSGQEKVLQFITSEQPDGTIVAEPDQRASGLAKLSSDEKRALGLTG